MCQGLLFPLIFYPLLLSPLVSNPLSNPTKLLTWLCPDPDSHPGMSPASEAGMFWDALDYNL